MLTNRPTFFRLSSICYLGLIFCIWLLILSFKNAFYILALFSARRKLFKDRHPKDSGKYYFFSPVGDYLMSHEVNQSYMFEKCGKCFRLANGSFNFALSDYVCLAYPTVLLQFLFNASLRNIFSSFIFCHCHTNF
ncbi:hypothetical protein PVAP13_9NG126400 [Panicum virgatum]|uniref:Uncharacterized protein n=1 Tax=Panicum virgatum TaxID=38727 RepID=A0A8T0ME57_PANVG|nr:hypothetical protein PVAP13_9NG126400 [Panicum virgatum]